MSPERKNLLIVDDDHGFLDLLKDVFKPYPYNLTCVDKPTEAVNQSKSKTFDVALLDYQLPQLNGDQLIAVMQEINPRTRFIVLTGMGGDEIEDKFRGRGYFGFFEKGQIDIQKLRDTIVSAFES
ncbi:MAG: response regulator [Candidatus Omnitrophica bacterium]|jgi:DNA-binding NtrC family response regulator|nr:response regulator [Candidatus Omnitrophota bacterium]